MATARQKERKKRELDRLEVRLSKGVKPERVENKKRKKGYSTTTNTVPMNDSDKKLVSKTIDNLKVALKITV